MEGAAASSEGLRYAEYTRVPTGAGKGQAELDRGLVSALVGGNEERGGQRVGVRPCVCPGAVRGYVCEQRGSGSGLRGTGVLHPPRGWAGRSGGEGSCPLASGPAWAWWRGWRCGGAALAALQTPPPFPFRACAPPAFVGMSRQGLKFRPLAMERGDL